MVFQLSYESCVMGLSLDLVKNTSINELVISYVNIFENRDLVFQEIGCYLYINKLFHGMYLSFINAYIVSFLCIRDYTITYESESFSYNFISWYLFIDNSGLLTFEIGICTKTCDNVLSRRIDSANLVLIRFLFFYPGIWCQLVFVPFFSNKIAIVYHIILTL